MTTTPAVVLLVQHAVLGQYGKHGGRPASERPSSSKLQQTKLLDLGEYTFYALSGGGLFVVYLSWTIERMKQQPCFLPVCFPIRVRVGVRVSARVWIGVGGWVGTTPVL